MYWYTFWQSLKEEKYDLRLSRLQRHYYRRLRLSADANRALQERQKVRKIKYHYKSKSTSVRCSHVYGRDLYAEIALYYERYYTLGKKNNKPRGTVPTTNLFVYKTTLTKNKNYRHSRYDELIAKERKILGKIVDDEAFLIQLYLKLPIHAFSDEEIDLWKKIYDFATTEELEFTVVKRSDRRTNQNFRKTYFDFACWYFEEKNHELYSCNSRFFVPLFVAHCKQNGFIVSSTKVDSLLRYDSSERCFTNDEAIVIDIHNERKDFFTVLKLLRETSKKSSRL